MPFYIKNFSPFRDRVFEKALETTCNVKTKERKSKEGQAWQKIERKSKEKQAWQKIEGESKGKWKGVKSKGKKNKRQCKDINSKWKEMEEINDRKIQEKWWKAYLKKKKMKAVLFGAADGFFYTIAAQKLFAPKARRDFFSKTQFRNGQKFFM